jgi:hypothetical protein
MTDAFADFRAAIERGDPDAAVALFATECVFHSPIVHKPYLGREPLRAILAAVVQVFTDFRYTAAYAGGDRPRAGVRLPCIGDRDRQGVDILAATASA